MIFDDLMAEYRKRLSPIDDIPESTGATLDAQSLAYRDMGPEDVVTDIEVATFVVRHHDPGDPKPLLGPDWYEANGWDAGREDPR